MQILKLTNGGLPVSWITHDQAAALYLKGLINWTLGDNKRILRGGINSQGVRSKLEISPIVAVVGARAKTRVVPLLTNKMLFKRDGFRCLYCGRGFGQKELTRDHVVPRGQGGADTWTNVVAACKPCNNFKGCRTPEQANMPLLAVPFVPNPFEAAYLAGRQVCSEQTEYLKANFSTNMALVV